MCCLIKLQDAVKDLPNVFSASLCRKLSVAEAKNVCLALSLQLEKILMHVPLHSVSKAVVTAKILWCISVCICEIKVLLGTEIPAHMRL